MEPVIWLVVLESMIQKQEFVRFEALGRFEALADIVVCTEVYKVMLEGSVLKILLGPNPPN